MWLVYNMETLLLLFEIGQQIYYHVRHLYYCYHHRQHPIFPHTFGVHVKFLKESNVGSTSSSGRAAGGGRVVYEDVFQWLVVGQICLGSCWSSFPICSADDLRTAVCLLW